MESRKIILKKIHGSSHHQPDKLASARVLDWHRHQANFHLQTGRPVHPQRSTNRLWLVVEPEQLGFIVDKPMVKTMVTGGCKLNYNWGTPPCRTRSVGRTYGSSQFSQLQTIDND